MKFKISTIITKEICWQAFIIYWFRLNKVNIEKYSSYKNKSSSVFNQLIASYYGNGYNFIGFYCAMMLPKKCHKISRILLFLSDFTIERFFMSQSFDFLLWESTIYCSTLLLKMMWKYWIIGYAFYSSILKL